jgi:hypothetical protein
MKKFFVLILCLFLSGQVLSQYRGSGGTASFKVVTDTTSNNTGEGKTFWFGSQPWIHDGTYYKLLNYSTPNGVQEGYRYRLGRATGTTGQVMALRTESTPDTTYFTTYNADNTALLTRNVGGPYTYMTNTGDNFGIGTTSPTTKLHVDGNITVTDNDWIGLGAAAGRIEFDDQTTDELNILNAHIGIGTSTPAQMLHLANGGSITWGNSFSTSALNQMVRLYDDNVSLYANTLTYSGSRVKLASIMPTLADFAVSTYSSYPTSQSSFREIFRISGTNGFFYVGDTTSGDKDWRLQIGDDADWTRYIGWDDGNDNFVFEGGSYCFNDGGADYNWRIESDADANCFVVDGGLNAVGIGVLAPAAKLDITSTTAQLQLSYNMTTKTVLQTNNYGDLTITPSGGDLTLAGRLGIGGTSTTSYLNILATSDFSTTPILARSTGSSASAAWATTQVVAVSTGNAVDGFGSVLSFGFTDTDVTNSILGFVGAVREDADNSGAIICRPYRAGVDREVLRISGKGSVGINDASLAGTYDLEVGDSTQIGGNLLLGAYTGVYSYIHPGSAGFTVSSTEGIKKIGPEKNVLNILDLAKQVQVREWSFDSSKVYEKFIQPVGFDTLTKVMQDSIRDIYEKPAKVRAGELSRKKHYTPIAEDWYSVSQHFGGSPKEINSEQVMWAQFLMIQKLIKRVEALETESEVVKTRLNKLEKAK